MKRHDAARLVQPGQQRRVVAVADERLWCAGEDLGIEQRQQVDAAVAAAGRDKRRDRRVRPGAPGTPPRATRRCRPHSERRSNTLSSNTGSKPSARSSASAGVEFVAREGAGGCDDGDAIAASEARAACACARRTSPFRPQPPGARRARAGSAARRPSADSGRGGARNRSLTRRWRASASSTRFSGSVPSSTA